MPFKVNLQTTLLALVELPAIVDVVNEMWL
jgi:hypothetical protein